MTLGIDLWSNERDLEEISRMMKNREPSVKLIESQIVSIDGLANDQLNVNIK
jgi:hypothetical protein